MRVLDCYIVDYTDTETKKVTNEDIDTLDQCLESLFLFSLVWSLGATGDYESRERFNAALVSLVK